MHSLMVLLMAAIALCSYLLWRSQSPWNLFDVRGFERLGVPSDSLDITNLTATLRAWEFECQCIFVLFAFIFALCFALQFCCTRKVFGLEWDALRMFLVLIYIHSSFLCGFVLVPTFYSFTDAVKLNASPAHDNAFTASSDILHDVDSFLGYGFGGVFLTFIKSQRIKRQMAQRRERESEPKQKPITVIEDVTYPALPSSPNKREGVGDGRDIKSRDNIRATAPQSRALGKRVRDASNDTDAVRAEDAKRRRLALMEILNQLDVEDFEEDERGAFAW